MHCCGIGVRGTESSPGERMRIDGHVASQLVAVLAWLSRQRREVLCITSVWSVSACCF